MNSRTTNPAERRNKQEYLREVEIFQDLAAEELAHLGAYAPMQRVAAGTVFYSAEETSEVLFILKEGRVRLYQLSPDGKILTTALLEAGTIFGEMALLGQGLHGSYAEALTPCLLCLMSREDVKSRLLGDVRIAFRITEMLGRRLIDAERRMSDFAFKKLPERIASLLLHLAAQPRARFLGRDRPEVRSTHEALAEMVGTYRETVTKILNELQAAGLIELRRGKILLVDTVGLERFQLGHGAPRSPADTESS